MQGYQGHKGFMDQYLNENRRNGGLAMMVEISGIEDEKNDDSIEVAFLYSLDPMAKDALGTKILPDFTFRLTENPAFTHYVTQLKGKIVDGVITTEPVKEFQMNPGIGSELTLWNASVRFEIMADGQLKGVVGGYQDWRRRMISHSDSNQEMLNGFTCPGVYNALKRAADGMKDPVTGECNGISAAYDIEGVPAFIPPGQRKALIAQVQ